MKKIVSLAVALGLASSASFAATITVSAGLPAQGINFQIDYMIAEGFQATDSYFFQPGNWDGVTWTGFGTPTSILGELKGAPVATAPASLQGLPVHVLVGTAPTMAGSLNGSWVVLGGTAAQTVYFPPDLTKPDAVVFNANLKNNVVLLATGNADSGWITATPTGGNAAFNLVTVPEASTALLGLLGLVGLVRRRRA